MSETYVNGLFGPQNCRTQPNDIHYTPDKLAKEIIDYYKPKGKILEPCKGTGAFYRHLPKGSQYCEISEGINFFEFTDKVDWIITNPPFSKLTAFMQHSFKLANNIVFLINVAALFSTYRIKIIEDCKCRIKEIRFVKQPDTFPQTGRIPGAVYFKKNYTGNIKVSFTSNWRKSYKSAVNGQITGL